MCMCELYGLREISTKELERQMEDNAEFFNTIVNRIQKGEQVGDVRKEYEIVGGVDWANFQRLELIVWLFPQETLWAFERERQCVHEAGHAVAHVAMFNDNPDVPCFDEVSMARWPQPGVIGKDILPELGPKDGRLAQEFVKYLLAGEISEIVKYSNAWESGHKWDSERQREVLTRVWADKDEASRDELLSRLRQETEVLLKRHWNAVVAVAGRLNEQDTLTYQEVLELMDTGDRQ